MAEQLASLAIEVKTNQLKTATRELDKLQKEGAKAERATDRLTSSTKLLGGAVAALGGSMAIRKYVEYADTMTLIDSKIKLATKSTQEFTKAQESLFNISQATRAEFSSTVDLYERITRSVRDYGIEQNTILDLTETINKSMIISGGTAESMNAAIMQLGQAFSADFQSVGQELASIREQTPRLYQALLEGTGLSSKAFKKAAEEGQLSSKIIINAIKSQANAVNDEFTKMNLTVGQSMTVLDNSLTKAVGTIDKATGISTALSNSLIGLAKFLDDTTSSSNRAEIAMRDYRVEMEKTSKRALNIELTKIQKKLAENSRLMNEEFKRTRSVHSGYYTTLANRATEYSNKIEIIKKQLKDLSKPIEIIDGGKKSSLLSAFTITDSDKEQMIRNGREALNSLMKQQEANQDAIFDKAWNNAKDLASLERQLDAMIAKENKKHAVDMGEIVQANMASAITNGIQAGFEDGDIQGVVSGFASGVGSAISQAYIAEMIKAGSITSAGILGVGVGVGVMALGSLLGKSSSEPSSADLLQMQIQAIDNQTNAIVNALEEQTKILTNFGDNLEALRAGTFETSKATFRGDYDKLIAARISQLNPATNAWMIKELEKQKTDAKGDNIDYSYISYLADGNFFGLNKYADDFRTSTKEYINSLLDVRNTYNDLSGSLKDVYDSLNDNYYANKRLEEAQKEVNALIGNKTFDTYLKDVITDLDRFDSSIESLKADLTGDNIDKQLKALTELEAVTGKSFEKNSSKALDYLESIELVGDSMVKAREEEARATEKAIELSDLYNQTVLSYVESIRSLADKYRQITLDTDFAYANSSALLDNSIKEFTSKIVNQEDASLELENISKYSQSALDYAKATARTESDYMFNVGIMANKLSNLADITEEMTLTNVVDELVLLREQIDALIDSTNQVADNTQTSRIIGA